MAMFHSELLFFTGTREIDDYRLYDVRMNNGDFHC